VLGGLLLVALLFISIAAPTTPSPAPANADAVVLQPAGTAVSPSASPSASSDTSNAVAPASGVVHGFSLGGGQAFSLAWRLALVVVIIAVSIVGLRWWGKKTAGPRSTTGFLRVVDTLAVGNGRTIHLVALGDRVIAVGATAQNLSFLTELSSDESQTVLQSVATQSDQPIAAFAAELFQTMRGGRSKAARRPDGWDTTRQQ